LFGLAEKQNAKREVTTPAGLTGSALSETLLFLEKQQLRIILTGCLCYPAHLHSEHLKILKNFKLSRILLCINMTRMYSQKEIRP